MKVSKKEILAEDYGIKISRMDILSPEVAKKAQAGQFVAVMVCREGERIPLTIVDTDRDNGVITIIFQEVGLTTGLLGNMKPGDSLYALAGPLGHATEIKNYGKVILVGGGVGIAEIYPVARALKRAGNHVTTIIGARTKNLLILETELKAVSDEFHVTTDDGSYGKKGFVTDLLKDVIMDCRDAKFCVSTHNDGLLVYAVGPIPMMKAVSAATKPSGIKTMVSLNALMVDATGMCGCCRVSIAGKTRFSCVDGPEFDGHLVDWDELEKRNSIYKDKETHICKLHNLK